MQHNIFRPSWEFEKENYKKIKSKVFNQFKSGNYTNRDNIIEICQAIYREHEKSLLLEIEKLNPYDLASFALYQYEEYAKRNTSFHNFELSKEDEKYWLNYESHSRRGVKHLLEYLCEHFNELKSCGQKNLNEDDLIESLSIIFISLEEMCSMYMRIQSYQYIFNDVTLTLDEKLYTYFHVPQDSHPENILDIRTEKQKINSYIEGTAFNVDVVKHSKIFGNSFNDHLGMSYKDIIDFFGKLIADCTESTTIISKKKLLDVLFKKFKIDEIQAMKIINGFSLGQQELISQGRCLFNPKQEYRAYHRGLFNFTLNNEECIVFSKTMASETLQTLVNNVCYKILPAEWMSHDISSKLSTLSNMAGKWFEDELLRNLQQTTIKTISSIKKLKHDNTLINIPKDVGEIDFIGFEEESSSLFIIEAKNVRFNTEPRLFRDDLSKFIYGKKSYTDKFIAKCQWVIDNIGTVKKGLEHRGIPVKKVDRIYKVMVILHPSIVEGRTKGFTCINMVKFFEAIRKKDFINFDHYVFNEIV